MAIRIWSEDLNQMVEFKDGTSKEEMERLIREHISKQGSTTPTTDIIGAVQHGVNTIMPKIKRGFANQAEAVFNVLPYPDWAEKKPREFIARQKESAEDTLRKIQRGFTPDTLPEKIASGLGGALGDIVPLTPYMIAAAPLAGVAGVSGAASWAASSAAGALGLGVPSLLEGYGDTGDISQGLKSGASGALEGAMFGLIGPATRGIKGPVKDAVAHATGAAAVGGGAEALRGGSPEDVAASALTMFTLSGVMSRLGKAKETKQDPNLTPDEVELMKMSAAIGPKQESLIKRAVSGIPGLEKIYNKAFNSANYFENIVSEMEKSGVDVPDALNPALTGKQARPQASAAVARQSAFYGLHDPVNPTKILAEPLTKIFGDAGIFNKNTEGDFFAYAIANRIADLGEFKPELKIVHPGSQDPFAVIRGARSKYGSDVTQKWDEAIKRLDKWGEGFVKIAEDSGEISAERAKEIRGEGDWISLMREVDTEIADTPFVSLRGGSGQRFRRPSESLLMQAERVLNNAAHNNHMRAVVDLLENVPDSARYIERIPNESSGGGGVKLKSRPRFNDKDKVVTYREYGDQVSYKLDPDLYNSLKRSGRPNMPGPISFILAGPKRLATLGMTGLNIGFQTITNPLRDFFSAGMQSQDPGFAMAKHAARTFKTLGGRLSEKVRGVDGEMTKAYARYKTSGATAAGPLEGDITSLRAVADEIIARSGGSRIQQFIKHPVETARSVLSWSEDVNRFPEYYMAEKKHGSNTYEGRLRGASAAADVTLDFMRMGEYTRWVNEFVPFFNASLQGGDKFVRTLKERPVSAIINGISTVTLPMIALWAINKDEEWYQEIPTWEKTIFAHFKVGDNIIRMPLPFEWGLAFGTMPIAALDAEYQKSPKRLKDGMTQAFKTMMPDLWPQAIKPIAEVEANKDFFRGRDIESAAMQRMLPSQRYRESTPLVYRGIGSALGVSPAKVQHLAESYTGGLAKEPASFIDVMSGKNDIGSSGLPVVGRLFSNQDRQGQSVADFYDFYNQMQQAWTSAKKRHESGDIIGARRILEDNAEVLGLSRGQIALLTMKREWTIPDKMKRFNKVADSMSTVRRRKGENKELTALARIALGRN